MTVALWLIAAALIVMVFAHGCVACVESQSEGSCYQVFYDDRYFIKRPQFGLDSEVAGGKTAEEAWAQAERACRGQGE